MIKREFKARMVDNFYDAWIALCAADEGCTAREAINNYDGGKRLTDLASRISGKIVILTENEYPHGTNDFFESVDNDFVISPSLFTEEL